MTTKAKPFQAKTIRLSIIPADRRVVLQAAGAGLFRILKAETKSGQLRPTAPMTLFLRKGDFAI